ncbi:eIF2 kinase Gcn2p negative regulator [Saitozyma podzolica]|uniref:eIF2 kinase Gcn2p negative regulator n=1 Tax=Saitozyma podzolica TaxID=1890683 RepID=A0A427YGW9_9TREE|nr:eIF2 kinase Gcn2p negative regulator [Saitozyma podzolica]
MPVITERPSPIDPALVSTLNKLTLGGTGTSGTSVGDMGTSNPRSARFADTTALPPTILGSNAALRGSSPSASSLEDRRRSPPVVLRDPEGVLLKFIEHLLAPEHSDSDPHLVAIGYELEALHSIYPGSVHLSVTSRPPSVDLFRDSIRDPVLDTVLPRPSDPPLEPTTNTQPDPSSPEVERSGSRDSQTWADAVFDASIWSPGERIRAGSSIRALETHSCLGYPPVLPQPPFLSFLVPPSPPRSTPDTPLVPFPTFHSGISPRYHVARSTNPHGQSATSPAPSSPPPAPPSSRATSASLRTAGDLDADGNLVPVPRRPSPRPTFSYSRDGDGHNKDKDGSTTPAALHAAEKGERPDFLIHVSTPIVDRKSTFMGHAVRVTDEREVPLVIHEILSDKKVAKAAHPAIFAYRIAKDVGGAAGKVYASGESCGCGLAFLPPQPRNAGQTHTIIPIASPLIQTFLSHSDFSSPAPSRPLNPTLPNHITLGAASPFKPLLRPSADPLTPTDCDDDGETAAGSRLAHLLEILEVENVLVVVTRWFGGIHLGPDRFKHINQVGRDALEVGGFLEGESGGGAGGAGKGKGRRR